jgi:hypothetical protein
MPLLNPQGGSSPQPSSASPPGAIYQILSGTFADSVLQTQLASEGLVPGPFVSPTAPNDYLFNPNATSIVEAMILGSHSPNTALTHAQQLEYTASQIPVLGSIGTWLNPRSGGVAKGIALVGGLASALPLAPGIGSLGKELAGPLAEELSALATELQPSEEAVTAWRQLLREYDYQDHHVFARELEDLWEEIGFNGKEYGDIHDYTIAHDTETHAWIHSPTGGNWNARQEKWLLEEAIPKGLGPEDAAQFVKDLYAELKIPFDPANLRPFGE